LLGSACAQSREGITTLGKDTVFFEGMRKGDTVEAVFHFMNAGLENFRIWQVHPGCQCTAPVYPKDTLRPGHMDSVVLVFYSAHTEPGAFDKAAIVLAPFGEVNYHIIGSLLPPEGQRPGRKYRVSNR
jgi:hypothetical protein